jgi:hypothetical protein
MTIGVFARPGARPGRVRRPDAPAAGALLAPGPHLGLRAGPHAQQGDELSILEDMETIAGLRETGFRLA